MVACRGSGLAKFIAAIYDVDGSGMEGRDRNGEGWMLGCE